MLFFFFACLGNMGVLSTVCICVLYLCFKILQLSVIVFVIVFWSMCDCKQFKSLWFRNTCDMCAVSLLKSRE